jgi:hypothetical protein
MSDMNVLGEEAIEQTIYVSPNSVLSTSQDMNASGIVLLRTLADMLGTLPDLHAITPSDIHTSLKVAEELILVTTKSNS